MSIIGYARVSTQGQELDLQRDALRAAGCDRIFEDHGVSGAKAARPSLDEMDRFLRDGDVLVVYKLDRLGRSVSHLVAFVDKLAMRKIGFRSLTEHLDTTTPGGRLLFHIFASISQFERDLIIERTHAGLTAAAARGRKGGRPRSVTPDKLARALMMLADRSLTTPEIACRLKVSKSALYDALAANKVQTLITAPPSISAK